MSTRIGLMFAGQGAQYPGMGRDLCQSSPAAAAVFARADEALQRDISRLCFEGTPEELTASANCQPAIYVVSVACFEALRERFGLKPAFCGGLSLGEFAALTAGGVLEFETGLRLVAQRGALMDEACRLTEGAMAAVLGGDVERIEAVCADCGADVANYNCPGQVVISGARPAVESAAARLAEDGMRTVMLQVAGAYHSRLMAPAAEAFGPLVDAVELAPPAAGCTIVQNVAGAAVTDPDAMRENLKRQVTGSVRWEACVRTMLDSGAEALIELGPGKVLSGFMKRIDRRFPVCNVDTPADLEKAAEFAGA